MLLLLLLLLSLTSIFNRIIERSSPSRSFVFAKRERSYHSSHLI